MRLRVDLEQSDVVEEIPADDLGLNPVAIGELDVDVARGRGLRALADVRDHVRAGQDVARGRDDEARTLRSLRRLGLGAEEREDRDHARCALGVELRRVEAPADERLRDPDRAGRSRQRRLRGRRRQDDRLRLGTPDPAGRLADRERADRAERGAEERDQGERSWAHRGPANCSYRYRTPAGTFSRENSSTPAGRTSLKAARPGTESSSTRPPISWASSRAIASPRPLPDASAPSTR